VYQLQKRPTGRYIVREIRLMIAERIIYAAFNIMPEGKEKTQLAEFIISYVDKIRGEN